jgi:hypothetical protein
MPTNPDRPTDRPPPAAPHGPQRGHVDATAGGADSSPFETESTDELEAEARPEKPRRDDHRPA